MKTNHSLIQTARPVVATLLTAAAALLSARSAAQAQAKDDVPIGCQLIEGDILVRTNGGAGLVLGAFPGSPGVYWPNGTVPFLFDSDVTQENRQRMQDAMAEWQAVAKVAFIPRVLHANFLLIRNGGGNSSFVGMQGGPQEVNIVSWGTKYIIAHELGHALGFWHQQSRADRDNYVRIIPANIEEGQGHNFSRHTEASHYGPYDFGSVMHYAQCDFSACGDCPADPASCRTIEVLPPYAAEWQNAIGQRNRLSYWDTTIMSFLYPEDDWIFVDATTAATPEAGRFLNPFRLLTAGLGQVPDGGTLWLLQPGGYAAPTLITKAVTLRAPLGGAVIGPVN